MKKQPLIIFALLITSFAFAQKSNILEGKWGNLKNITKFNLVFDYSNLEIPNFESEEAFLKEKMQMREEKKQGDGERFKKSWFADREDRYEPKFIESFNKRWSKNEVEVDKDLEEVQYVLNIHTTFMYAGYNVGAWRQNSKIDAILTVYDIKNPENILFKVKYTKAEGNGAFGNDYNSGYRISEAYAKLAKTFAAELKKKA